MISPAWWGSFLSFCFQWPCSQAHRQVEVEQQLGQCPCPTLAATPPQDITYRVVLSILPLSYLFSQLWTQRGKTSPCISHAEPGAGLPSGVTGWVETELLVCKKVTDGSPQITTALGVGLPGEMRVERDSTITAWAKRFALCLHFRDFLQSSFDLYQWSEQGKSYWLDTKLQRIPAIPYRTRTSRVMFLFTCSSRVIFCYHSLNIKHICRNLAFFSPPCPFIKISR